MSWILGRFAAFDTETTGVDVETDRIVTACVVQCGGGQPTAPTPWLSDAAGVEIPAAATAVHGITTGQARAEGAPAAEVIEQIVATLSQAVQDGIPLVIANARFDLSLLDREARRHGVQPLTDIVGDQLRVVDPFVLDKQADRFRKGKRTLEALCVHYQVRLDRAHDAAADAIAAARVAWRIGTMHARLAEMSLDDLHQAQIGWAAEQAVSLQRHLRTKDPAAVVEGAWPLIPHQRGGDQS